MCSRGFAGVTGLDLTGFDSLDTIDDADDERTQCILLHKCLSEADVWLL